MADQLSLAAPFLVSILEPRASVLGDGRRIAVSAAICEGVRADADSAPSHMAGKNPAGRFDDGRAILPSPSE